MDPEEPADTPSHLPAHLTIYGQLREMILCGDLAPGQAVTIQGLTGMLGGSATPVREAIRRLTSEGALLFQGNRRVSVPVLTLAEVEALTFGRVALEAELARRAALVATPALTQELRAIDAALDRAIGQGDARGYLRLNHRFHMTLYAAADSAILSQAVNGFWLRAAPSLRIMCGRLGTQNLPDMHHETIAALERRDPGAAAAAIARDIRQGMDNIRAVLLEAPDDASRDAAAS
ncbi:GntR family transcriptional regulator [Paenirhodobacter enshiensis]|uniref:GntR family transcriptional regulator n=1 Tax=Paenirhodobacter enshiensis TaxID=1105367 RepID=UPI003FA2F07A